MGGTKVAFRLETEGLPPYQAAFPWPAAASLSADLAALAREVGALGGHDHGHGPIEAVGVAMPATVDRSGRVTTWPNRPYWTGLDLGAALRELFPGAEARWADDGDLAALAEARLAGCRDVVYLGVGTGIGGGVVLDGRLLPGIGRGSCEIGHLVVDRSGAVCACGRRGCVQAVASGPATLRRAAELRGAPVEFAELATAFAAGDGWATAAVEESCDALAAAAVGVSELTSPELVLVGGGFAHGLPGFTDLVAERVRRIGRPGGPAVTVRAAALDGLSSLHGAVLLARGA
ncbi:ROK family protein [Kitasatospora sp. NPDC036755]|uniref:ROK family protein n=1 Tax=Kitasatospora sp. NPDC036755 TaxID=3154600 RepID=UPI0033F2F9F5